MSRVAESCSARGPPTISYVYVLLPGQGQASHGAMLPYSVFRLLVTSVMAVEVEFEIEFQVEDDVEVDRDVDREDDKDDEEKILDFEVEDDDFVAVGLATDTVGDMVFSARSWLSLCVECSWSWS